MHIMVVETRSGSGVSLRRGSFGRDPLAISNNAGYSAFGFGLKTLEPFYKGVDDCIVFAESKTLGRKERRHG